MSANEEAVPDEEAVARAYEEGRRRLLERDELGGSLEGVYCLMPAAVFAASAKGADIAATPAYDKLTPEQRFGVRIIYEVIADIGDPIEAYPRVFAEIACLGSDVVELQANALERDPLTKVLTPAAADRLIDMIDIAKDIVKDVCDCGIPATRGTKPRRADDLG